MTKEVGVLLQKRCSSLACRLKEKEKKNNKVWAKGKN